MAKHRGYASDEQESEEEDESLRSENEGELEDGDEDGFESRPMTAQERKRAALHPPISSICSALGGFEEFLDEQGQVYTAYSLGDQVVGCLKDLKRFWRMDEKDDDRTVARIFHEVGVLKNDLLPILSTTLGTGARGDRIALACVELIGAMTWPINVAEELRDAQILGELKQSIDYTTLTNAQLSYKSAILRTGALRQMMKILANSLEKSRRERTQKDENVISLVLHTFRNLAAIQDRVTSSTSADAIEQSSLQSELIVQLESENILQLLLAMAAQADSTDYAPWNMVVLDILHLVFRGVKPDELMVPVQKIEGNRLRDMLDLEARQTNDLFGLKGSRHSRFGTTIAVKSGDGKKYILHKQSTLAEGPERTMDKVKKTRAKKVRQEDDLAPPAKLRPDAIKVLYETSKFFLESAFNPFFASILRDIRMERLKVRESDTIRFLFLVRFFLEFFLLVYHEEEERGISHLSDEGHDFGLIAEMTEPQAIGFVTQRMKKGLEEKPPLWTELHAGIDCFNQMLLIIEALQTSGLPDHVDVAEILQNKLYYEAETLDMVLTVLVKYTNQSYKYLDSVITLSYTLLRMLEKYSKSKAYMYVRKKKAGRAAKKKKAKDGGDENAEDGLGLGEDEEEEEIARGTISFGDHAFEFEKFEQRFADEAVLSTCMIYLESYKTFKSPEQMKRIVALMHRQAIKAKSEGLFYKPTVLELFKRILDDSNVANARQGPNVDLRKLIEYILKKFFKAVQEHPLLLLECFYPKTKTQLGKMRLGETDPYASSDDDTPLYRAKKLGEVEVEPGFSHTQQVGIAITCLVDSGRLPLIEVLKEQLRLASSARTEVVLTTDGIPAEIDPLDDSTSDEALRAQAAQLKGPSEAAIALFTPHNVDFGEDPETKEAASSDPHYKLLMRLLGWESEEAPESAGFVWSIPAPLPPSKLDSDLKIIDDFLLDPIDPQNGKSASDLLRKQRKKPVRRKRRIASEDEIELGEDGEPVPKPKKKRQKKREEEEAAYKSAQFIEDSDDDEEADARFFAAEAALRDQLAAGAVSVHLDAGTKKKKAASASQSKKSRKPSSDSSEEDEPTQSTSKRKSSSSTTAKKSKKKDQATNARGRKKAKKTQFNAELVSDVESEGDDAMMEKLRGAVAPTSADDRPATSSPSTSTTSSRKRAASITSASSATMAATTDGIEPEEEEEEAVGVSQAKKRRVILDSDEED
ncbi:Tof1p [Sporobolomyces salmoneus]|uniref:Tof1p n=1 Tax=Sporobolomyces salmoneus TaxID=183962 RepID=UPI00316AFDBF